MKPWIGLLGQVLKWLLILGASAAIIIAVLVPRIGGATPYTVLTGSMKPTMPPGTLVVSRPIDPDAVRVGDVVTVQLTSGDAVYVTHRVTSIQYRTDGALRFQTKGDANPVADAELRRPEQIRGKRWYSVPYLGYVNQAITGHQRQLAVYAVAGGLLIYAAWMFASSLRTPTTVGTRKKGD